MLRLFATSNILPGEQNISKVRCSNIAVSKPLLSDQLMQAVATGKLDIGVCPITRDTPRRLACSPTTHYPLPTTHILDRFWHNNDFTLVRPPLNLKSGNSRYLPQIKRNCTVQSLLPIKLIRSKRSSIEIILLTLLLKWRQRYEHLSFVCKLKSKIIGNNLNVAFELNVVHNNKADKECVIIWF